MKSAVVALWLLSACVTGAQESIVLVAPIPSVNAYVPGGLMIELRPRPMIIVTLIHEASGRQERFEYPCDPPCQFSTQADVAKMIASLNTANLTTRSLWHRLMDRLVLDFPGRFAGGAKVE